MRRRGGVQRCSRLESRNCFRAHECIVRRKGEQDRVRRPVERVCAMAENERDPGAAEKRAGRDVGLRFLEAALSGGTFPVHDDSACLELGRAAQKPCAGTPSAALILTVLVGALDYVQCPSSSPPGAPEISGLSIPLIQVNSPFWNPVNITRTPLPRNSRRARCTRVRLF